MCSSWMLTSCNCLVLLCNLWEGLLQCGQAAARQMAAQNTSQPGRGGTIINMSSVNAVMAIPSIAGYNAAKGGVNNLTRCEPLTCLPLQPFPLQASLLVSPCTTRLNC